MRWNLGTFSLLRTAHSFRLHFCCSERRQREGKKTIELLTHATKHRHVAVKEPPCWRGLREDLEETYCRPIASEFELRTKLDKISLWTVQTAEKIPAYVNTVCGKNEIALQRDRWFLELANHTVSTWVLSYDYVLPGNRDLQLSRSITSSAVFLWEKPYKVAQFHYEVLRYSSAHLDCIFIFGNLVCFVCFRMCSPLWLQRLCVHVLTEGD